MNLNETLLTTDTYLDGNNIMIKHVVKRGSSTYLVQVINLLTGKVVSEKIASRSLLLKAKELQKVYWDFTELNVDRKVTGMNYKGIHLEVIPNDTKTRLTFNTFGNDELENVILLAAYLISEELNPIMLCRVELRNIDLGEVVFDIQGTDYE